MSGRQIANLQGLRGVAALLVVLYHLQPALNRTYGMSLGSDAGMFGVDIFFVLSGFVMFYSNPDPVPSSAARFLVQRFFRIVPLYWLATLAVIAFFLAGFRPVGLHELSPMIVAQSFAFVPSSFAGGRHDLILTIGWTLMFELFFYVAFALTFALRSLEKSFVALAAIFIGLSLLGKLMRPMPYLFDFYTSPIMIEFLFGAAVAILYLRWTRGVPQWLPSAGLALLLIGFALSLVLDLSGVGIPNKHGARFLVLGIPALLVVAGALAMERGGWVLRNRFFLELGAASYALYLFHLLVLQISVKLAKSSLEVSPAISGVLAVAASTAAAILIHRLAEQPILRWSRRLASHSRGHARPTVTTLAIPAAE